MDDGTSPVRRALTAVFGTRTARVYFLLCCALLSWAVVDAALVDHEDASLAGVVPLLATAPPSLLLSFLVSEGGLIGYALVVLVSAAVNAALIGWCVRAVGAWRNSRTGRLR